MLPATVAEATGARGRGHGHGPRPRRSPADPRAATSSRAAASARSPPAPSPSPFCRSPSGSPACRAKSPRSTSSRYPDEEGQVCSELAAPGRARPRCRASRPRTRACSNRPPSPNNSVDLAVRRDQRDGRLPAGSERDAARRCPSGSRFVADLRMQGYDWRQILVLLAFQAVVLGLVASAVGVVLGDLLSHFFLHRVPAYLTTAFPVGSQEILHATTMLAALGCGVLATGCWPRSRRRSTCARAEPPTPCCATARAAARRSRASTTLKVSLAGIVSVVPDHRAGAGRTRPHDRRRSRARAAHAVRDPLRCSPHWLGLCAGSASACARAR